MPTKRDEDYARAVKLLASAEIEVFIESLVLRIARTHELDSLGLPTSPALSKIISQAIKVARSDVHGNHGVKEENVTGMFRRVGIDLPEQFSTVISTLNAFAKYRGEIAHKSARVAKARHPQLEHKTIRNDIIPGLLALDEYVTRITSRAMRNAQCITPNQR